MRAPSHDTSEEVLDSEKWEKEQYGSYRVARIRSWRDGKVTAPTSHCVETLLQRGTLLFAQSDQTKKPPRI
ncbi:MAG: hypothetical protein E8D41_10280 [Nitrospira sp.]|nr:MAG: hypothetical protein E8D41_10280 [Nitrospira sp.]